MQLSPTYLFRRNQIKGWKRIINLIIIQEKRAINSILYCLPTDIRSDYKTIWQEYILNKTDIAHFVHEIYKFEMMLQAKQYVKQGYSYKSLVEFFNSTDKYLSIDESNL